MIGYPQRIRSLGRNFMNGGLIWLGQTDNGSFCIMEERTVYDYGDTTVILSILDSEAEAVAYARCISEPPS